MFSKINPPPVPRAAYSTVQVTSSLREVPTSLTGRMATTGIHDQIAKAFLKMPNVARTLHGERNIRQGGRGRRTALFPSSKCRGNIPVESRLELAYAVVLERSPEVQEYRTQAIRIPLPGGQFSFPDFLVRMISGTVEVHEVKPSIENLSVDEVQRFTLVQSLLAEVCIPFRIIDTRNLPSTNELEDLLHHYSRGHLQTFSAAQIDLAKSLLLGENCRTYAGACQLMKMHDLPMQIVDFLSFHQQWVCAQPPAERTKARGTR